MKSYKIYPYTLMLWVFMMFPFGLLAQDFEELKDFFTWYPNKRAAALDSELYKSKLITAPVVSYSPETNFGFGVGAKYLFKFRGSGDETRTSNMPISFQYTLNNQFILYSGFEVFTNQEEWVFTGNVLFQNYPRLFYGLGRNTLSTNEVEYNYNQLLLEPIALKQLGLRYLFLGAGLRFNYIYNVNAPLSEEYLNITGYEGSTSTGVELAALYDSRNNILNAQNGWYFILTHGIYSRILGGSQNFQLTKFDLRHYIKLFPQKSDVLAFQLIGHFTHRNAPFGELALFGGDRMLRGYREGRFVDRNLLAAQIEYRKTFANSRWGYVLFAGAGDVAPEFDKFSLSEIKYNVGLGLRFMIDKPERLNLRLDWGKGQGSNNNIYFNIAESF